MLPDVHVADDTNQEDNHEEQEHDCTRGSSDDGRHISSSCVLY